MTWTTNPLLVVNLNGEHLATDVGGDQVLIDELRVDWGTDDPLVQPDPATGRLSILDFTLQWAARADAQRGVGVAVGLMGAPVRCAYTADPALAEAVDEAALDRVFFRGRITSIQTHPPARVRDTRTGELRWSVRTDLGLTSVETDLANRFVEYGTDWPDEPISARAARIASLASRPITTRADWADADAMPMRYDDLKDVSCRDLILQLFNSCGGDKAVYVPDDNRYEWLGRRQADTRTFGALQRTNGAHRTRSGQGVYAISVVTVGATGVNTSPTANPYLDGAHLESADPITKAAGQIVTRATVTFHEYVFSAPDDPATRTFTMHSANADESIVGEHAITLDSLHYDMAAAMLNAGDLLAAATQEGAGWRPPRLRWDTRKTGGFQSPTQVDISLRGHATGHAVWIGRSWFSVLGVRPVFSVIGGSIAYADGGWVIDYDLAGWTASGGGNTTPDRVKQHALTWDEFDPSGQLVWRDEPANDTVHESLTYEDLGFIGVGWAGGLTVGPDQGWDEYQ